MNKIMKIRTLTIKGLENQKNFCILDSENDLEMENYNLESSK